MKIYPTITTTDGKYFEKLEEANKLGLTEVCFFVTQLSLTERNFFYPFLEKSSIKFIPLVHIKEDMEVWELDFFLSKFKTKVFNCHSQEEYPLKNDLSKFKKNIFIENTNFALKEEEIKSFGGVCVDFSHLDISKKDQPKIYESNIKIINHYKRGCGHISARNKISSLGFLRKKVSFLRRLDWPFNSLSAHYLIFLNEVDYLKEYKEYFPEIIAIELENSLKRQLEVISYIYATLV